mgnify:CR=1 FL=1
MILYDIGHCFEISDPRRCSLGFLFNLPRPTIVLKWRIVVSHAGPVDVLTVSSKAISQGRVGHKSRWGGEGGMVVADV